jgi:hypothetical protein
MAAWPAFTPSANPPGPRAKTGGRLLKIAFLAPQSPFSQREKEGPAPKAREDEGVGHCKL